MDDAGQVFLLSPEMLSCPEVAKGCYTVIACWRSAASACVCPLRLPVRVDDPQLLVSLSSLKYSNVNGDGGGSLCNVSKCKHNCKVSNATAEV